MLNLIITVGLPSSGKSTWAKEFIKNEPGKWKRVNKDLIRAMLDDSVWSPENEDYVNSVQEDIIVKSLRKNINIINDNTNLSNRNYKRMVELAKRAGGDIQVEEKIFDLDVEECIKRDSLRQGISCVGEKVIRGMYDKYKLQNGYPKPRSEYVPKVDCDNNPNIMEQNEKLPKCIISDIDGSIATINGRNVYDTAKAENDKPIEPTRELLRNYNSSVFTEKDKIIFLTGREERFRDLTYNWILFNIFDGYSGKHGEASCNFELFMRPDGNKENDAIYKTRVIQNNILPRYNVQFVLEDRPRCVRAIRELGLMVFQLNDKEF